MDVVNIKFLQLSHSHYTHPRDCYIIADCIDGDVRLEGLNSSSEGRVEVCFNGSYYTICDDFWDILNAQVVCQQLGMSSTIGT